MSVRARDAAIVLIVLLVPFPIYLLRLDRTIGLMVDDAWYVMLGKALAQGDGYRLINSPLPGILPMYPPGFPAILSLVFRVHPHFPANLWLLKTLSIAAMLGVGWLTYLYLHRDRQLPRHLAACASIALTTMPAFVLLATSTVMSECVFTLVQLGAVVAAHRAVDAGSDRANRLTLLAAILTVAAVLIRSAGAGLVAAVCLAFLKERRWSRAAAFAAVTAVCLLPWFWYSHIHTPGPAEQEAHRGSIVFGYGDQFWMRRAGSAPSGRISASELPERVGGNIVDVFARGVGGILAPALLRGADESGEEVISLGGRAGFNLIGFGGSRPNMAISLALSAIVVFGYIRTIRRRVTVAELLVPISLVITVLWPWWTFRFVLPLSPFLLFYFVQGLRWPGALAVARIAMLTIIGLNLWDHAGYTVLASSNPDRVDWLARSREIDGTIDWMATHLDRDAVVATTNPALVHMLTGHRTIMLDSLAEKWSVWRQRGVRYVACLTALDLPDPSTGPYTVIYESSSNPSTRVWVIRVD